MKKDNFYSKLSIILTTLSSAVLNIYEYVFNVSSILVCPKYLATTVTLSTLLINREPQECLKSCILICGTPTSSQFLFLRSAIVLLL